MIRAFELAVQQLGDPKLRGIIWWSLLLSLVLQVAIAVVAWWGLKSFATFEWKWINEAISWASGAGACWPRCPKYRLITMNAGL